jgi:hypothetical protein
MLSHLLWQSGQAVCVIFCISASSKPTVYELVIKAPLDTSVGGWIFCRKIGESLLRVDRITGHFGHWFIKATLAGTRE